jgi:hypothetical protein
MNLGDEITFGKYKWNIISIEDDKLLLLCANPLKINYYHKKAGAVYWEISHARHYLNHSFIKKFSEEERAKIVPVNLKNFKNFVFDKEIEVEFADTYDSFFLLSLEDVSLYFGGFEDCAELFEAAVLVDGIFGTNESVTPKGGRGGTSLKLRNIAKVEEKSIKYGFFKKNYKEGLAPPEILRLKKGEKTYAWWLRSNGVNSVSATLVDKNGFVDFYGAFVGYKLGVYRPAVWIKSV